MDITVNGEPRTVADGLTLAALLGDLQLDPKRTVVERNGTILGAEDFGNTRIEAGDTLELVRFVGGG